MLKVLRFNPITLHLRGYAKMASSVSAYFAIMNIVKTNSESIDEYNSLMSMIFSDDASAKWRLFIYSNDSVDIKWAKRAVLHTLAHMSYTIYYKQPYGVEEFIIVPKIFNKMIDSVTWE